MPGPSPSTQDLTIPFIFLTTQRSAEIEHNPSSQKKRRHQIPTHPKLEKVVLLGSLVPGFVLPTTVLLPLQCAELCAGDWKGTREPCIREPLGKHFLSPSGTSCTAGQGLMEALSNVLIPRPCFGLSQRFTTLERATK